MKIWDRQKERNKDTQKDEARYRVALQLKITELGRMQSESREFGRAESRRMEPGRTESGRIESGRSKSEGTEPRKLSGRTESAISNCSMPPASA